MWLHLSILESLDVTDTVHNGRTDSTFHVRVDVTRKPSKKSHLSVFPRRIAMDCVSLHQSTVRMQSSHNDCHIIMCLSAFILYSPSSIETIVPHNYVEPYRLLVPLSVYLSFCPDVHPSVRRVLASSVPSWPVTRTTSLLIAMSTTRGQAGRRATTLLWCVCSGTGPRGSRCAKFSYTTLSMFYGVHVLWEAFSIDCKEANKLPSLSSSENIVTIPSILALHIKLFCVWVGQARGEPNRFSRLFSRLRTLVTWKSKICERLR